jgi:hypothetical protein
MCRIEFPNAINSLLSNPQASGMFMQLAYVIKKIYNFNKDPSKQTLDWHMFASHAVVLADTTSSAAYHSSSHGCTSAPNVCAEYKMAEPVTYSNK